MNCYPSADAWGFVASGRGFRLITVRIRLKIAHNAFAVRFLPPMKSSAGLSEESWQSAEGRPVFYSSCSIAQGHSPCAFSLHPLMTWWPSRLLQLPVFRKSIPKVSRRQHTYSCVDVKPLTSLREFRITLLRGAKRFFGSRTTL